MNGTMWMQNNDGTYVKVGNGDLESIDIPELDEMSDTNESVNKICLNKDLEYTTAFNISAIPSWKWKRVYRTLTGWTNKGPMRKRSLMRWINSYEKMEPSRIRMLKVTKQINDATNGQQNINDDYNEISWPIDISETPCTDFTEYLWWTMSQLIEGFDEYKKQKTARQNRSKNRVRRKKNES